MKNELVFCIVIISMGLMDWGTTMLGVSRFGASELNPLLAGAMRINLAAFSALKISASLVAGLLFYQAGKITNMVTKASHVVKNVVPMSYAALLVGLTVVVTNNLLIIAR